MPHQEGRGVASSSSQSLSQDTNSEVILSQMLHFTHYEEKEHYKRLEDLPMSRHKYIDMGMVRILNLEEEVTNALSFGNLRCCLTLRSQHTRNLP